VRERDRVGSTNAQRATAREVVHRPADESKAHVVQIPQWRRDDPRQRAVDERLEQHRLKTVFAIMQRDHLVEDGLRRLRSGPPALHTRDLGARAPPQGLFDETLLRCGMQVKSSWRNVCAARDVAHPERVVAAPSHLAQCSGLDRRAGPRDATRPFSLYIRSCIHCIETVAKLSTALDPSHPPLLRSDQ
jgi:hypothetical protein